LLEIPCQQGQLHLEELLYKQTKILKALMFKL
jgi:hypothetical protein